MNLPASVPKSDQPASIALIGFMRYPWWSAFFGILSMALFRIPLWTNKRIVFWRLMGSGKNGSFSMIPDIRQWSILVVMQEESVRNLIDINTPNKLINNSLGKFISTWNSLFKTQIHAFLLEPMEGHGAWNGRQPFGNLDRKAASWEGPVAVLTRATIRYSGLKAFWQNVDAVARQMATADGFITSYGVGEMPLLKQATFSIWKSKQAMINFAYSLPMHKEVIRKTRLEKWYSEDMYVRFRILKAWNKPEIEEVVNNYKVDYQ